MEELTIKEIEKTILKLFRSKEYKDYTKGEMWDFFIDEGIPTSAEYLDLVDSVIIDLRARCIIERVYSRRHSRISPSTAISYVYRYIEEMDDDRS